MFVMAEMENSKGNKSSLKAPLGRILLIRNPVLLTKSTLLFFGTLGSTLLTCVLLFENQDTFSIHQEPGGSADGLRDVRLETRRYTLFSGDVELRCSYDLEAERLYAVKWYRNADEFYRFIPMLLRPKQTFPQRGIYVDYFKSDDHHVVLKNASFETNGKYKCVVSVDGSFQTFADSKDVDVVVIGHDSPILLVDKLHYQPDDIGMANCTTIRPTSPPVNISWFINDKLIQKNDKAIITRVVEDNEDPRLSFSISSLMFHVPSDSSKIMKIRCVIQLYDVYSDASVTRIQVKGPSARSRKHQGSTPGSLQHNNALSHFDDLRNTSRSILRTTTGILILNFLINILLTN